MSDLSDTEIYGNADGTTDLAGSSVEPEDLNQSTDSTKQDQPDQGFIYTPPKDLKPVGRTADGSIIFNEGTVRHPDGTLVRHIPETGQLAVALPGQKFMLHTPAKDATGTDAATKKMLVDRGINPYGEDNNPISGPEAYKKILEQDKNTGKLTAAQQHEVDKVTTQANSSRSMYARQYVTMQPNYVSVLENVTGKPVERRTGMDDAYLISASAGLENPGRATTGEDFALLLKTQGIRGNLQVMGRRIEGALKGNKDDAAWLQGTRILSDAQVNQTLENANRAIKPRYDEYLAGQKPYKARLERVGVNPDDYLPDLKLPEIKASAPAATAPAPNIHASMTEWAKAHINDPQEGAKARAILEKQKALGLIQ